ncbi:hypothetical protein CK227_35155 [Mesorhizobium sp. WSM4308]|nr:hypothetical protein CK232_34665 [Mesorhizobium sp. WSM4304]PBB70851.1 hypothetical protein CK227_35155 [Mesorhizobium sp. WSM4308]
MDINLGRAGKAFATSACSAIWQSYRSNAPLTATLFNQQSYPADGHLDTFLWIVLIAGLLWLGSLRLNASD